MAFPASSRWGASATCAISLPGRGRPRGRWEDRSMELDPVDRITTDAVGEPGERVFYLQARQGDAVVTVTVEKQQVQLLAASILEILSRVGKETGQGPDEEEMSLEEPVEARWRAGRLSIGYLEERDLILLEIEELVPEAEAEAEEEEDEEDDEVAPEEGPPAEEVPETLEALEELEGLRDFESME